MSFTPCANNRFKHMLGAVLALLSLANFAQLPERADYWNYTVDHKDSLIAISKRFLNSPDHWKKLQEINNLRNADRLTPGTQLKIPLALLSSRATVATVKSAQGKNTVVRHNTRIESLPDGTELLPGDRVETGLQSTLTISFADGSQVVIAPLSKVLIENLLVYGKTGISETRLRIEEGAADSKVKPLTLAASKYVVTTPVFNLGVRGTEFRARFDPQSQTAFSEVLEGGVAAQGKTSPVLVGAGFGSFAVINAEPSLPQKLPDVPLLNGFTPLADRVPARLSWLPEPGVRGYRAQVFTNRAMDRQLLEGVFNGPQTIWPQLPDGNYVLSVRAIDSQGLEGVSKAVDFAVQAHPVAPPPVAPVNTSRVYGPSVKLQWGQPMEGERVRVQVAQDAEFKQIRVDFPEARGTEFTTDLPAGSYFWRTASVERSGKQGPFSEAAQFTQRVAPVSPLISPATFDGNQVVFRWLPTDAGQSFRYQLASDSQFTQHLVDATTRASRLTLETPAPGTYYFRIQATDAEGAVGPFGSAQVLTVSGQEPSILNRLPAMIRKFID